MNEKLVINFGTPNTMSLHAGNYYDGSTRVIPKLTDGANRIFEEFLIHVNSLLSSDRSIKDSKDLMKALKNVNDKTLKNLEKESKKFWNMKRHRVELLLS